jgi:hypothetical protein
MMTSNLKLNLNFITEHTYNIFNAIHPIIRTPKGQILSYKSMTKFVLVIALKRKMANKLLGYLIFNCIFFLPQVDQEYINCLTNFIFFNLIF